MVKLIGSCHCGRVRFDVETQYPVPYQRCYCGICRKTSGGGGFLINLSGDARTLAVTGSEHVRVYRATIAREGRAELSQHERHFCAECGSHLWAYDPRWPDLVHPVASAIDSELPRASEVVHMMLASKPSWVEVQSREGDRRFDGYPDESIASFHEARGWTVPLNSRG